MTRDDVHGDVQFLTGSPQRGAVLRELCEAPARPSDLCERVDATRTTVQRILAGFCERDWVVKRDGRYRATGTGRRVADRYAALREEVARAREFGPVAVHLGDVAADLPEAAFEGEVTAATDRDPLAAVDRLVEWFGNAEGDRVRAVSPIVAQSFNRVAADLIRSGTEIEYVIDPEVLERSAADFETELEQGVEHEMIRMRVHPESLSYGLLVGASDVMLGAYDEDNNLRATLESSDPEVVEWATERFEALWTAARPLPDVLADEGEKCG